MTPLKPIPYDNFVLAAVVRELEPFVGGKVQGVRQPNEWDVALTLYSAGSEAMLYLSCHPTFFRALLVTRRPPNQPSPQAFVSALRARIDGARLVAAEQILNDRVLELRFEGAAGEHRLIAELMGKHSNLILVDAAGRVLSAAKWVSKSKSARPILPGIAFEWPPVLTGPAGPSRFLTQLLGAGGSAEQAHPVLAPGYGAYPVSVAALGYAETPRASVSLALEQHYGQAIPAQEREALRASLLSQLDRVLLAREVAIADLTQAVEAAEKASRWQRFGELILAYGAAAPAGSSRLQAWDYDGTELSIELDPELDFKDNANRYFERAKKAKARLGMAREQIERLSRDRDEIAALRESVATSDQLDALQELRDRAKARHWLMEQRAPAKDKEDRPYQGHRIRELLAPGGFTILYGENAEANDYLTLRVAKPNDYWLHVRGGISAHVVIQTRNHPERVQKETLLAAAKVAVQHSPAKHAGYVPVDYTLKKYVRKPRGAPHGTALYTNEKTLHIES